MRSGPTEQWTGSTPSDLLINIKPSDYNILHVRLTNTIPYQGKTKTLKALSIEMIKKNIIIMNAGDRETIK